MNSFIKELIRLSDRLLSPDIPLEKKHKTLIAIHELDISLNDLKESNLGKSVKKSKKLSGEAGKLAGEIIQKWLKMINEPSCKKIQEKYSSEIDSKYENSNNHVKCKNRNSDPQNTEEKPKNKYKEYSKHKNVDMDYEKDQSDIEFNDMEYSQPISDNVAKSKKSKIKSDKRYSDENDVSQFQEYSPNDYNNTEPHNSKVDYQISNHCIEKTVPIKLEKSPKHSYNHNINSESIFNTNQDISPTTIVKSEKSHRDKYQHESTSKLKSSKKKSKHTFESFLVDSAISTSKNSSNTTESMATKRKSETQMSFREMKQSRLSDLPHLPEINSPLSRNDFAEQSIYSRTDLKSEPKLSPNNSQEAIKSEDDIDCTSKYASERKIWMPNRKIDVQTNNESDSSEDDVRTIKGVRESAIATYDFEKLLAFDADDRAVQKQTEKFWEKLFLKVHKCCQKRDHERWRDAFLRAKRETDNRLKEISARVKRNNDEKINAVNKAKMLHNVPVHGKGHRRITDMRR